MPVLAPLKAMFDGMLSEAEVNDERPPAEARAAMHALIDASFGAFFPAMPPMPVERDYEVPVPGGAITVRHFSPLPDGETLPAHVYLHSGGFWLGTLDQTNSICRALATDAGCAVISVDYRLAPEYKFPTAIEDSYAALAWVAAHAEQLGIDPTRLSIGGASAGGNLAAAAAIIARDRAGPALCLQVLEIPVTDLTDLTPLVLSEEDLVVPSGKEKYRAHYLSHVSEADDPRASPLLAATLAGLPPALVICAEYDPLRREGEAYAHRLTDAGVRVELHVGKGQFHGSQYMAALIPDEVAEHRALIASALKAAHQAAGGSGSI